MNITTTTTDKGNYILLNIYDVHNDEILLTFSQWFSSELQIDTFKGSKVFKSVFNALSKIK